MPPHAQSEGAKKPALGGLDQENVMSVTDQSTGQFQKDATAVGHSSAAEDAEQALTPKRHGFAEAELLAHECGLHHAGQPHSAFHETEAERKNRLSAQRIAQSSARLLPGS
jgi:hypothetical protein